MNTFQAMVMMVGILAGIVGVLLVTAVLTTRRTEGARRQRRIRMWGRLLPDVLEGRRSARKRFQRSLRTARDIRLFEEFLAGELKQADREAFLALRHLSRSLGVTDHLYGRLKKSRSLWKRATAARALGLLREREARNEIARLLEERDPTIVMVAGYACASLQDPTLLIPVLQSVYSKTTITLHGMAEMLSRFGPGACPTVHEALARVVEQRKDSIHHAARASAHPIDMDDVSAQVILIDLIGFFRYAAASTTMLSLLELTPHEEVQTHLMKALVRTGGRGAAPLLTSLLSHTNWVVRSQAASALGALGTSATIPRLNALLEDENHWVRSHAQTALRSLGSRRSVLEA